MTPVLESLRAAIRTTSEVLERHEDQRHLAQLDRATRLGLRAGLIKHFEFTYELSWKAMQRWVRDSVGGSVDAMYTRLDVFRRAGEAGLIADVERWIAHHRARNLTSHTYRQETADQVLAAVPGFLEDARALLLALESRDG